MRFCHLILLLPLTLVAGIACADTTETTVTLLGYPITFAMVLSWLLVPLSYVVTEVVPVPDRLRPVVPFAMGTASGLLGHFAFGIAPEVAQTQFFAACAAGNMSGWLKTTLPWVISTVKKGK